MAVETINNRFSKVQIYTFSFSRGDAEVQYVSPVRIDAGE